MAKGKDNSDYQLVSTEYLLDLIKQRDAYQDLFESYHQVTLGFQSVRIKIANHRHY